MPGKYHQLDTPSGGKAEVRAALLRAGANSTGRYADVTHVSRALGPHYDRTALTTLLDALVVDGDVVANGTTWRLTTQGQTLARSAPNPRFIPSV